MMRDVRFAYLSADCLRPSRVLVQLGRGPARAGPFHSRTGMLASPGARRGDPALVAVAAGGRAGVARTSVGFKKA